MNGSRHPSSLIAIAAALCAALYAVGCYATAYIPSPWGFGQFRPAVIIPSLFGAVFGPLPAALGAAIGTLIADSLKHGTLYMGSLLAAVPGNFIGFYIFGYILKKKFNWTRFISASVITLIIGNAITAFLYVFLFKAIYMQALEFSPDLLTFLSFGLTIYWFVTMLPFILIITPILIRAVALATPTIVPEEVRTNSLKTEFPKKSFSLAVAVPGLIMIVIGLATTFTPLGVFTASAGKLTGTLLIELMYYIGGATLITVGLVAMIQKRT
ncbi:MAG: ECF transporter S component [Candidatus Bathyarchaeia archaeon]